MQRATLPRLTAAARGVIALLAACSLPAFASTQGVVVSQVYGGGGNSGAPLNADFIELLNAGTAPVSLAGWSVQYASSTGVFSNVTPLSGTIQPKQYYLVAMAPGATGAPLPAGDANGTLLLSASTGKVIVANVATALNCTGVAPSCSATQLASIVDLVGYGSANAFEGAGAAPGLSNTTAALRAAGGCADTNNNNADFTSGAPAPRNSASALATCSGGGGGGGTPATIMQIQGNGATSPLVGKLVATGGVVTKVDNNGFFLQDPVGDNDPSTSDGIFVFTSSAPTVVAGQQITLDGTVSEFNVGAATNPDTLAHKVTELTGPTGIVVLNSNQTIQPTPVQMPLAAEDDLEKYEGMLVQLVGPFTVQQNYFLGRFGELTLAAGGRLEGPTNRYRPGTDAQSLNTDNIRRTLLLDDGTTVQNPNPTPYLAPDNTIRAGDTTPGLTGVVDYGLTTSANTDPGAYKIHPTQPPVFTRANPRTTAPDPVGGNVKVASANVLNFFTTLDDGVNTCPPSNTPDDCRGANNAEEFGRQRAKIVDELAALNADVVGLMELQNNGSVAIQNLVDALNAQVGAGTYAIIPDAPTGPGTDAIKVGIIYKPARLGAVGAARSDAAAINNRAPIAQTFQLANGEKFNLVVNHLKSKGCDGATGLDLDQGDLQGCWNNRRVQQADELRSFVAGVQTASGVTDTLLVGDFNAYAKEDPIIDLTGNGFVDQIARYNTFGYSYVFNGTSGRLDHAIANVTLSPKVTGAYEWHNNADEPSVIDYNLEFKQPACPTCGPDYYTNSPYRASDHDPVVIGLNLTHAVNGTAGRDTLVGTAGDDVITGGAGADTLTGNGGRDVFVYTSLRDASDTINDFTPADDRIDLGALLASIGASPVTAIGSGVVTITGAGTGTVISIDQDGSAGPGAARPLVTLLNVAPASIDPWRDLGLGQAPKKNALRAPTNKHQ